MKLAVTCCRSCWLGVLVTCNSTIRALYHHLLVRIITVSGGHDSPQRLSYKYLLDIPKGFPVAQRAKRLLQCRRPGFHIPSVKIKKWPVHGAPMHSILLGDHLCSGFALAKNSGGTTECWSIPLQHCRCRALAAGSPGPAGRHSPAGLDRFCLRRRTFSKCSLAQTSARSCVSPRVKPTAPPVCLDR